MIETERLILREYTMDDFDAFSLITHQSHSPDEHIKNETEKFYDIINMFYRTIKCYFWKCK